jgi:hypothetical protein
VVATQLAAVLEDGARLRFAPDPARPVFHAPDARLRARLEDLLTPETKPTTQALLRHAVRYRDVLRRLFHALAELAPVAEAEARVLLNAERRCVDELGVALADAVRAQIAEEWTTETGLCPWCGGPAHRPGDTGDEQ